MGPTGGVGFIYLFIGGFVAGLRAVIIRKEERSLISTVQTVGHCRVRRSWE